MSTVPIDAKTWLGWRDDLSEPDSKMIQAIEDADTCKPPPGIDQQQWGAISENDREQIAKFAAVLRVVKR
jgi:hypothetical protein